MNDFSRRFVGSIIPLGLWTEAELYIGIITGSLPACRALFIRLVARARNQPLSTTEDSSRRRLDGPGRHYMLHDLPWVGRLLTRSRRAPRDSIRLSERSNETDAMPWRDARKIEDQDNGMGGAKDHGITKTITLQMQREERGRAADW